MTYPTDSKPQDDADPVSELTCLERYNDDIADSLREFIFMALDQRGAEDSEEKQQELLDIIFWHVEHEANHGDGDDNQRADDEKMRELIGGMEKYLNYVKDKEGRSGTTFDNMIKHFNVHKKTKMSKSSHACVGKRANIGGGVEEKNRRRQ